MQSPPSSPPQGLQGASRTVGGTIRGRALGNNFNFSDYEDMDVFGEPVFGKVKVFNTNSDPSSSQPIMGFKHKVTPTLGPVLAKLARQYSPVRSKFFVLIMLKPTLNSY